MRDIGPAVRKGFCPTRKWNKNSKTESGWSGDPARKSVTAGV
jgi:hypothetical protein